MTWPTIQIPAVQGDNLIWKETLKTELGVIAEVLDG